MFCEQTAAEPNIEEKTSHYPIITISSVEV